MLVFGERLLLLRLVVSYFVMEGLWEQFLGRWALAEFVVLLLTQNITAGEMMMKILGF